MGTPTLRYPDNRNSYRLITDVSLKGIDANLTQKQRS